MSLLPGFAAMAKAASSTRVSGICRRCSSRRKWLNSCYPRFSSFSEIWTPIRLRARSSESDPHAELNQARLIKLAGDRAEAGGRNVGVRAREDNQVEHVERSGFERQTHSFADAELSPQADVLAFGG